MYQNIHVDKNDIVHLWDDEKGYFTFPYQRYAYVKDKYGSFTALDGTKVKMISQWDKNTSGLYESDVRSEMRTLIDLYHESDRPSTNHLTMFFDIEVSVKTSFPNIAEANQPIISITYHLKEQNHSTVLILDPDNRIEEVDTPELRIITFRNEEDLLRMFLTHLDQFKPTIISGWYSDGFDIPYIYHRMIRLLSKRTANKLSPIGIVTPFKDGLGYTIAGISSLDYMRIYKGFTQGEKSSYSLDFIAKLEIGRGKVEYEGTLDELYEKDPQKFIQYNLEDVLLIRDMDKKLNFIALTQAICHKGHVPYENIHYTSAYLDGAALTYMKRVGVISPNRKSNFKFELELSSEVGDNKLFFTTKIKGIPAVGKLRIWKSKTSLFLVSYKKYADNYLMLDNPLIERVAKHYEITLDLPGAYVQEPKPGLYEWIYDLDLTSLYPSEIMSLNISPETKVGRVTDWDPEDYVSKKARVFTILIKNKRQKVTTEELKQFLVKNKYSIAANGVFYKQDTPGFLPTILSNWFEERSELKDKRDKFGNAGDKEKYLYYDLRQMVYKVLLNSFYGVLALPSFRFYDVDNAEAITSSGQQIIKFTKKAANNYYQKILGGSDNYVIYIDTDSIFCSALPLVKKLYPTVNVESESEMTQKILVIAKDVQTFINKAYDYYADRYHNSLNHRFFIKQEVISKTGFWVAKKRYAQWMIYKEGISVDEMDVKGIDTVRSDFPLAFKTFFEEILSDILNKRGNDSVNDRVVSFKNEMKNRQLADIMFPTGVKDIDKYNSENRQRFEFLKGTPVHVKSSLTYNDYLDYLKLNTGYITNGEKIKWIYLKDNNPMHFETLALKGGRDPKQIVEYIKSYVDYEKAFKSKIENKLNDFYNALGWNLSINKNINNFFSF